MAYLGDALYEAVIRRYLILERGIRKPRLIHRSAVELVRADTQARIVHLIEGELEPEEAEIIRRGRNMKTGHVPPKVQPIVYRYSTAWETLLGYLYLTGREERMETLIRRGIALATNGVKEEKHAGTGVD
jgi:ribonuclease-3 family protein